MKFDPTDIGTQTATISIANDDSDEDPYTFDVSGIVTPPAPEINILGSGITIPDGDDTPRTDDDTDFGSAAKDASNVVHVFTIQNIGTLPLDLTGSPDLVSISGSSDFSVTTQPATDPIPVAGSTTFVVTFDPTTFGTQTATVSIANNDSNEDPYTFTVFNGAAVLATFDVDQRTGPNDFTDAGADWKRLGNFSITGTDTLTLGPSPT